MVETGGIIGDETKGADTGVGDGEHEDEAEV